MTLISIGNYIIKRLESLGVKHVFGVPGDFILGFYHLLELSNLKVVNTCDEQGAGYAADAYSRIAGLGVVCVTYCVGGFKVINTTAEAFSEQSPVIVISGGPSLKERKKDHLLHHRIKGFDTQKNMFKQVTEYAVIIDNYRNAQYEIDKAFDIAIEKKRPVYIELPRDIVGKMILEKSQIKKIKRKSNLKQTTTFITEVVSFVSNAKRPVILSGLEVQRFSLQKKVMEFVENTNIPFASTILAKSTLNETPSNYLGVYQGGLGADDVKLMVEKSDCLIIVGVLFTDVNLGIYSSNLKEKKIIMISQNLMAIKGKGFIGIDFLTVFDFLKQQNIKKSKFNKIEKKQKKLSINNEKIKIKDVFSILNSELEENMLIVSDVGDSLFGALDLDIPKNSEFISPSYYMSVGYAVPAAIGAALADRNKRPLIVVGDGAFQMTGMELSTALRFGVKPIVIIINNGGYTIERPMQDGKFNDVLRWHYHLITKVLGDGIGISVKTDKSFKEAITLAKSKKDTLVIIDVLLDPFDMTDTLKRLTASAAKKI